MAADTLDDDGDSTVNESDSASDSNTPRRVLRRNIKEVLRKPEVLTTLLRHSIKTKLVIRLQSGEKVVVGEDWCRHVEIPSRFKIEREAEDSTNTTKTHTNVEANEPEAKIVPGQQEVPLETPDSQDPVVQDIDNFVEQLNRYDGQEAAPTQNDPEQINLAKEVVLLVDLAEEIVLPSAPRDLEGQSPQNKTDTTNQEIEIEITDANIDEIAMSSTLSPIEDTGETPGRENRATAKFPLTIPEPSQNKINEPACQLIVTGIATEFPTDSNSLLLPNTNTTLHEVHSGLAEFGYVLLEGDIIDANQSNTQASNNTTIPITVTYRNKQTKTSIARAAQTGKIWNIPTSNVNNRGNTYSFREVSQMRQRTKGEMKSDYSHSQLKPVSSRRNLRRNRNSEAPSSSRSQLPVQPIPNLETAMDIRERRVAEKNEKDKIEEILREKEKDAARNESTATPMPSGDEWTPAETEVEPDLRDRRNETKRIRP